MPPRSKTPVSSFGPELLSALRAGTQGEQTYLFPTPQMATKFIARLNSLRAAMRREGHEFAEAVYRAGIRHDPANKCRVIVAPKDSEFSEALKIAGTAVPMPVDPLVEKVAEVPLEAEVRSGSVDDFLGSLGLTSKKDVDGGG